MGVRHWLLPSLASWIVLGGCAAVPPDRGLSDVATSVSERGLKLPAHDSAAVDVQVHIEALLAAPLTLDSATSVALLRNPALRLEFATLGFAQSDVLQASRLSNPTLSLEALSSSRSSEQSQITFGLVQNFTDVLFWGARNRIAKGGLDRTKLLVGARLQNLAADVAAAYYATVGAQQIVQTRAAIGVAAGAASDLAQRFYGAGNLNERDWRLEQAAATEAQLALDAASADAKAARTSLNRLMGLDAGAFEWRVDAALRYPVVDEIPVEQLRTLALESRLDRSAKQREVAVATDVRKLARSARWLGVVDVGVVRERETDGSHLVGPTVSLQLPLFDQGQGSLVRADALVEQAHAELAALDIDITNDVTQAYDRMLAARERAARSQLELIPQRQAVVARTVELQNYMIVGQFELLVARQQEYDAYQLHMEALRDYWLARVELGRLVGAALPSDARIGADQVSPILLPKAGSSVPRDAHDGHSVGGHAAHPMATQDPGMAHGIDAQPIEPPPDSLHH